GALTHRELSPHQRKTADASLRQSGALNGSEKKSSEALESMEIPWPSGTPEVQWDTCEISDPSPDKGFAAAHAWLSARIAKKATPFLDRRAWLTIYAKRRWVIGSDGKRAKIGRH